MPWYKQARFRTVCLTRAWLLRVMCASWSIYRSGVTTLDQKLADGERLVVVFWHGKFPALIPLLSHRKAYVFTSLSARGNIIKCLLEYFGFLVVQIPDHGGEQSLDIMREVLGKGAPAAIAVDGPLGPYHVVHRGAVQLASELGYKVVPVSIAASRKYSLSTRWDNLELPKLFSRVSLVVGDPIAIPAMLGKEEMSNSAHIIKGALDLVDIQAAEVVHS